MFCPHCGKENKDGVAFCGSCGKPITNRTTVKPVKKPFTALYGAGQKII